MVAIQTRQQDTAEIPRNTILIGDALATLRTLPSRCVQCVVTSPPYYELRDYGVPGQYGLEPTLDAWLDRMMAVFDEVHRVLKPTGTLWLNIGDSYANDDKWGGATSGKHAQGLHGETSIGRKKRRTGFKPKDLMLVPFRLALALQAAGWWVRSDIIWNKPAPMPESVTDRPTRAHEYVFLLTRSERYYYDAAAIREPLAAKTYTTFGIPHKPQGNDALGNVKSDNWGRTIAERRPKVWTASAEPHDKQRGHSRRHAGFNDHWDHITKAEQQALGCNKRDVWTVAAANFPEAHYATFPPALIEPMILAGSRPGDLVLDPFMGSGTTAVVAAQHGRDYLGIELSHEYAEMARRRIAEEGRPVVLKRKQRAGMRKAGVEQKSLLELLEAVE